MNALKHFVNKMLVIRATIYKMLVGRAKREIKNTVRPHQVPLGAPWEDLYADDLVINGDSIARGSNIGIEGKCKKDKRR